jgi:ankyrin repeat protein
VWLHVQMQRTPLHEAARNGHEAMTRALLTAGADVNAQAWVQSNSAVVGCVLGGGG